MKDNLSEILKGHKADYIEIRLEKNTHTGINYEGKELEEISQPVSSGGSVRALVKGGWGFVSFNDTNALRDKVELAVSQATIVGKEDSHIASLEPIVDTVLPDSNMDPTKLSLSMKKALLDEYNAIIWGTPKIQTSTLSYSDGRKDVIFANSEGSYIEQSRVGINLRVSVIARDGTEIQQAGLSLGSSGDFTEIQNLHEQVQEVSQRAVELLAAPRDKGGEYTVVLDPVLAGVFVHEAFGHLSESDFLYEDDRLKELMVLGRTFGKKHLNIIDDPTLPKLRGSYKYDDEGTRSHKSYLVREGVLVGRLHSRETAAKMNEPVSGNARTIGYRHPPIVRMSNTLIEPGDVSFKDMIADTKDGLYVKDWYGGTTAMEMFTFSAREAYRIRNGKIEELLRPVVLSGNVFTTLQNIDAIGDDLHMNQGGGCGKGGQFPLPVSDGSPHIRIQKCLVGGG
ncbi:MAG: TldD/PmbA family protein [Chloroflexota bacterium]|nr:TldD/PmbA family protein [Chloroflexota bacterium]